MSVFRKWLRVVLAEEFRVKSLFLRFSSPELFSESPWFPSSLFIIYRLVITAWSVIVTVESTFETSSYLWLLQLDNWSISLSCLYFVLATLLPIYYTVKAYKDQENKEIPEKTEKSYMADDEHENECELLWTANEEDESHRELPRREDRLPCYHAVLWVLQTLVGNSILVVILCYAILEEQFNQLEFAKLLSIFIFMVAEAVFSFAPIRLLHFLYSYVFSLTYVLVVLIYYFLLLDKLVPELPRFVKRIDDPLSSTVVFMILIVGQPLFQLLYFTIHKLNCYVYFKYHGY